MLTPDQEISAENHQFLIYCRNKLNESRNILLDIQKNQDSALGHPALCYSLILYSVPFHKSNGKIKDARGKLSRHKIDINNCKLSNEQTNLHGDILFERDKVLVHMDFDVPDPQYRIEGNRIQIPVENMRTMGSFVRRIPDIVNLIEHLLGCIEKEIRTSKTVVR